MSILITLACLASLGFCVEELPDLLRRQRLARERQAHDLDVVQARLALAIDRQWREFGCARGMTAEELARTRRATAAKHPPPVGPSPIPMKFGRRSPSAKMCVWDRCHRAVDDGPLPGGSPSIDPAFCSWGCEMGQETRMMWLAVREAKARASRS